MLYCLSFSLDKAGARCLHPPSFVGSRALYFSPLLPRHSPKEHGGAAAQPPAPDEHGPARVPRRELLLGLLAAAVVAAGLYVVYGAPPVASCGRGARADRAPPAPAACHAGLRVPFLRVPLRAVSPAAAAAPRFGAHAAPCRPGVPRGGHLRGARARARALGGIPAPRGLPQVRARAGARGAAARRQRERRRRAGRGREPRRPRGGVRAHAASAGGRGGRGVARDGAGRARREDRDTVVEADGRCRVGRGVRRPGGREACRRAALAWAKDGRVRRGPRGRGAVRRRGASREPRARCRTDAPGRVASASCVPVQARQLERIRDVRRRAGRQEHHRRATDGDAEVVATAALPRQQRNGRAGAEQQREDGDGDRARGADREAQLGAAGGDPGALAAPLRGVPGHRLAKPRELLHALVRGVAQAARLSC